MHAVTDTEFARTHARSDDPATSHAAAASAAEFSGTHCARILSALCKYGPMTKDQIARRTGLTPVQVDRRLPDLYDEAKGKIYPTGETRNSDAGRPERVWAAVAEGGAP